MKIKNVKVGDWTIKDILEDIQHLGRNCRNLSNCGDAYIAMQNRIFKYLIDLK